MKRCIFAYSINLNTQHSQLRDNEVTKTLILQIHFYEMFKQIQAQMQAFTLKSFLTINTVCFSILQSINEKNINHAPPCLLYSRAVLVWDPSPPSTILLWHPIQKQINAYGSLRIIYHTVANLSCHFKLVPFLAFDWNRFVEYTWKINRFPRYKRTYDFQNH